MGGIETYIVMGLAFASVCFLAYCFVKRLSDAEDTEIRDRHEIAALKRDVLYWQSVATRAVGAVPLTNLGIVRRVPTAPVVKHGRGGTSTPVVCKKTESDDSGFRDSAGIEYAPCADLDWTPSDISSPSYSSSDSSPSYGSSSSSDTCSSSSSSDYSSSSDCGSSSSSDF